MSGGQHQPHDGNEGPVAERAGGSLEGPGLDALAAEGVPTGVQPSCVSQRAQADGAGLLSVGLRWLLLAWLAHGARLCPGVEMLVFCGALL